MSELLLKQLHGIDQYHAALISISRALYASQLSSQRVNIPFQDLWCQMQVSRAWISNDIPHTVGCHYLSMPLIPASGTGVFNCDENNYPWYHCMITETMLTILGKVTHMSIKNIIWTMEQPTVNLCQHTQTMVENYKSHSKRKTCFSPAIIYSILVYYIAYDFRNIKQLNHRLMALI